MATKEDEFRERFAAQLQDLRESHRDDPETMFLIGSLAARLLARTGRQDWPTYKGGLTGAEHDELLADFQKKGNEFYAEGSDRKAYAMQVLAMSLIARTQNDPQVRAGNRLLDDLIDHYIDAYQKAEKMTPRN